MSEEFIEEIGERQSDHKTPDLPGIPPESGAVIGLGIDIVARERVVRMLENHGERFLERCFTSDEAKFSMTRKDPIPDLAVRLAAKEASFKAIGARRGMGIGWREFETVLDSEDVPTIRLHGKAKVRGELIGAGKIWLSLTHEDLWAVAAVVVTGKFP